MDIPTLETDRLILRGHTLEDYPAYAAMWADPLVTRFIGGEPMSDEEAWKKFLRSFGQWAMLGYGQWSVHEKASGERVGETGLFEARRDMVPSLIGIPEAGWAFAASAHGKGYATEAVRAAHAWADAHFGRVRTACIIAPENTASRRVALKCGYGETLCTTYRDQPTLLLYRDPP